MDTIEPLELFTFECRFVLQLGFRIGSFDLLKLLGCYLHLGTRKDSHTRIHDTAVTYRQTGD